jgi:hypothetical protein
VPYGPSASLKFAEVVGNDTDHPSSPMSDTVRRCYRSQHRVMGSWEAPQVASSIMMERVVIGVGLVVMVIVLSVTLVSTMLSYVERLT